MDAIIMKSTLLQNGTECLTTETTTPVDKFVVHTELLDSSHSVVKTSFLLGSQGAPALLERCYLYLMAMTNKFP